MVILLFWCKADSGIRIFNYSLENVFFRFSECSQYRSVIYQNLQNFVQIPNLQSFLSADPSVKSYDQKCFWVFYFSHFFKKYDKYHLSLKYGKETTTKHFKQCRTLFYSLNIQKNHLFIIKIKILKKK